MSRHARALYKVIAAGVLTWLVGVTAPSAQGVTGTVSGTIRDAQGGVVPGATVTLISEARRTVSAPVFTNQQGDFVFPNVAADTYTIQVEMPSFRTLRRTGLAVSPGSIVALGPIVIEVGGQQEVVTVTAETPSHAGCATAHTRRPANRPNVHGVLRIAVRMPKRRFPVYVSCLGVTE